MVIRPGLMLAVDFPLAFRTFFVSRRSSRCRSSRRRTQSFFTGPFLTVFSHCPHSGIERMARLIFASRTPLSSSGRTSKVYSPPAVVNFVPPLRLMLLKFTYWSPRRIPCLVSSAKRRHRLTCPSISRKRPTHCSFSFCRSAHIAFVSASNMSGFGGSSPCNSLVRASTSYFSIDLMESIAFWAATALCGRSFSSAFSLASSSRSTCRMR
mmetsp:Transcript_5634/g.14078  ORF Transcript_5634/g.14078 Transcript_5634/m.14078 type:complete len:210 (-) Transcript_5634:3991-4620(-)